MEEKRSFVARCREVFGLKDGQKLTDFAAELRALTNKDRDDLCRWFNEAGMPTDVPVGAAQP